MTELLLKNFLIKDIGFLNYYSEDVVLNIWIGKCFIKVLLMSAFSPQVVFGFISASSSLQSNELMLGARAPIIAS